MWNAISLVEDLNSCRRVQFLRRGATTPGQSGPGSDGNEGVLRIPQISSIAGTSTSDCLVSYPGHSLGRGVLPLGREAVGVFYNPSRLGKSVFLGYLMPKQSWKKAKRGTYLILRW